MFKIRKGLGFSSGVERLPNKRKAMGSFFSWGGGGAPKMHSHKAILQAEVEGFVCCHISSSSAEQDRQ